MDKPNLESHERVEDAKPADAGKVDIIFPRYFVRREEGLFIDLAQLPDRAELARLIERMLAAGYLVRGLLPEVLEAILYGLEPGQVAGSMMPRLGDRLDRISPARLGLYRNVQIADGQAYYLFERVFMPAAEASLDDGAETEAQVDEVEAHLDLDEFLAHLWGKGVRAGLDMDAIRAAIEHGSAGRVRVAASRLAQPGTDASVRELWSGLRRDDTPRVLPDGRADLTQFSNRFPQVKAGVRLLKKVPPEPGRPGLSLDGSLIEAPLPSNFELDTLAGTGTRIESEEGESFLVATIDGFVDIDAASNRISVTEAIVHRQGVSVRTTGDLALMGDHYEEYGEIQEKRTVEGRSITAHANVFGNLVSSGGLVLLKKNLSGGSAINRDGPVVVEGLAVSAWLHAPRGEIRLRRAEACVLSGQRVVVEEAIACEIYGESVSVKDARACLIAGALVEVEHAAARGGSETTIFMLQPRTRDLDQEIARQQVELERIAASDAAAGAEQDRRALEPDFERYSKLMAGIRAGEIVLRAEQKQALELLARRAAPTIRAMKVLSEGVALRADKRREVQIQIDALEQARQARRAQVACKIDDIFPGVVVKTAEWSGELPLGALSAAALKAALHSFSLRGEILHQLGSGSFSWRLAPFAPDGG